MQQLNFDVSILTVVKLSEYLLICKLSRYELVHQCFSQTESIYFSIYGEALSLLLFHLLTSDLLYKLLLEIYFCNMH